MATSPYQLPDEKFNFVMALFDKDCPYEGWFKNDRLEFLNDRHSLKIYGPEITTTSIANFTTDGQKIYMEYSTFDDERLFMSAPKLVSDIDKLDFVGPAISHEEDKSIKKWNLQIVLGTEEPMLKYYLDDFDIGNKISSNKEK